MSDNQAYVDSSKTDDDGAVRNISDNVANKQTPSDLETIVNDELDRIGQGGRWVWTLFLIGTLPNILNGFHVSSYVFLGKMPTSYWCEITPLTNATSSWTTNETQLISSVDPNQPDACYIRNLDYGYLSTLTYADALEYIQSLPKPPGTISCLDSGFATMKYTIDGSSIVPEWDLVCENNVWRTVVQVAVSLGKCIGASTAGILSDKFGRRNAFAGGAILYTAASLLTTFSPLYWPFLIGRFFLGSSSSGLFYPALISMTENVAVQHRYWIGIAFNMAYPIGFLYMALIANFVFEWRDIQLYLTIPAATLIVFWYFFKESPRWLISKGRFTKAYRIVFRRKADESMIALQPAKAEKLADADEPKSCGLNCRGLFKEFRVLYGPSRQRKIAIICHFAFFTSSFSYYVTALNADNLSSSKVIYVAATGCVDLLAYSFTVVLLRFVGRKWACFSYFATAGICMLILIAVPLDSTTWIVTIAMCGRFSVSSVYAIITLYTAELFPTEIRNSAVGFSSTCGHVGSMIAPFVVDLLGGVAWFIPTTICGSLLFTAALLILLNPETSEKKLDDHVKYDNNES